MNSVDKLDVAGLVMISIAIVALVARVAIAAVVARNDALTWPTAFCWPTSSLAISLRWVERIAVASAVAVLLVRQFQV